MPALIHTLVIERPYDTGAPVDDYGQPVRAFADLATVQGLVQPKSAREMELTSQAGAEVAEHTIYLYRRDLTTADRIRATDGTTYEITGIRDHDFGSLAHLAVDARRISSPELEAAGS